MIFKSKMNELCDSFFVELNGNNIDFVHETKYLGVIINSSMKTSSDVVRQTRKFYAQTNMLLRNFRYCTNDVECTLFKSFCANRYCCPLWFNSTSFAIKKLKISYMYNSTLRNLLLIKKPYSASTMFITHGQGRIGPAAHRPHGRWAPGSTMHFFMNLYVVKHI